jgi:alanine-alpha-ketoisovalerate/valine-pyruvate aminotransferase
MKSSLLNLLLTCELTVCPADLPSSLDSYPAQVQMAGGVCKFVPLQLNEETLTWSLDMNQLESTITPLTKILLINSPHNPTGKVFTHEEYLQIIEIINRHPQIIVVMDEVCSLPYSSLSDSLCRTLICFSKSLLTPPGVRETRL